METQNLICGQNCANWASQFTRQFLNASVGASNPTENFLTCPVGLLLLLSTLLGSGGPKGATAKQIAGTLGIDEQNPVQLTNSTTSLYQSLSKSLTSEVSVIKKAMVNVTTKVMRLTNGLFVRRGFHLESCFVHRMKKHFGATVSNVIFDGDGIDRINQWTNKSTGGLVPQIFQDPSELQDAVMVMMNVLTFKDNWFATFVKTTQDTFYLSSSQTVPVEMMYMSESMNFVNATKLGFSLIHKRLKNTRFSFVVVLPNRMEDMTGAEKVLRGEYSVKRYFGNDQFLRLISLRLPKFKLRATNDLQLLAQKMGISHLFQESTANLTGLTHVKGIYVSRMAQGVALNVDEYGVEAAAVNFMVSGYRSRATPLDFRVNHPFVCMIYDSVLDIPIFSARVMNPTL